MNSSKKSSIDAKNMTMYDYLIGREHISIPRYQRSYSWEKKNIETLILDLKENYYVGNIIEFYDSKKNENEIIDGQQRIITTFLILISIYHSTSSEEIKEEIKNMVLSSNGKCKLYLKSRISNDGSDILEYLINSEEVSKELEKKYNELKMYKVVQKILKDKDIDLIYKRLKCINIVKITFIKNEYSAHEMFVNVNTKGKPLEMIEILKSQLFSFLLASENSDIYKEAWEEMLKNIPSKEYNNYCSDIYLLDYSIRNSSLEKYKTNGNTKDNSLKLVNTINSIERAKYIFDFMTGSNISDIYQVYNSIKNYKIAELKSKYYTSAVSRVSFGEMDDIWSLYGEFGFKQCDILFTTLFYKKERLIANCTTFVNLVLKYVFMYDLYRSVSGKSPASYENIFKQRAVKLVNVCDINDIKKSLKEFIEMIKIDDYDKFKNELISPIFDKSKYKTGKFIIFMAEKFYTRNLTVEHFVPQSTKNADDMELVGYLGNLIPVANDIYESASLDRKLELYERDKNANKGIENFMKYRFDEHNYSEKIKARTNELAKAFIDNMKEYYDEIMKG